MVMKELGDAANKKKQNQSISKRKYDKHAKEDLQYAL